MSPHHKSLAIAPMAAQWDFGCGVCSGTSCNARFAEPVTTVHAKRLLLLVDTGTLGQQRHDEFPIHCLGSLR